jgi:UDP-N-acetylmuramyl pentapeptide phosphotransferase/UDP-N-acetylglucosamine-1-phosphate transferase
LRIDALEIAFFILKQQHESGRNAPIIQQLPPMTYFASCFLIGLLATFLVLRLSLRHDRLSSDHDLSGPQKFHAHPVPRVGGAGVMVAFIVGAAISQFNGMPIANQLWLLLLCSLPAFGAGIAEDLTKNVSPRRRLLATAISAGLAVWLLDAVVTRVDIPGIDQLIHWAPLAIVITIFAVTGVANSINIIDGFNGLASMCVFIMVLALAYVAFQVGDTFVFTACLVTSGAVLGFFVWNFPAGLIFLGDGGAYLLGFLLAELGILLVHRNAAVSPIFPLLLCAYPIFETLFTMYRRKVVRGVAAGMPDGIHLHTLIHRRLIRWTLAEDQGNRRLTRRNSMTSPYLWLLCLCSVVPAVLWWDSTLVLSGFLLLFIVSYVWLYSRIVRFKTPKALIFRRVE